MSQTHDFQSIARIPLPGDNVAIATQRLNQGDTIIHEGQHLILDYSILEGHRFAIAPIAAGEPLLSWGLPFGRAITTIAPGTYVCNASMLEALETRRLDFNLPATANFRDEIVPYQLDETTFQAAEPLPRHDHTRTFLGYRRSGQRGVGTRNTIVLLGTTSRAGSFVKQLETRLKDLAASYKNVDGVVAVAHTEGGDQQPNNLDLLLRTLAGFMVHPNIGAVLAVDYDDAPVTNQMLRTYMTKHGYPLTDLTHQFMSLQNDFEANLAKGQAIVTEWLEIVNRIERTAESVAELKIALQCGGSDAFSGISGNPLASWVAKAVIQYGGAANLAETDELIGAESYALQKVKDLETAREFLETIARFKERAAWHGHSAEGNPSGGNKFRGLYNIVLKSIGAAMKRHPDVPLDGVLAYSQLMPASGYYFMDSPGNDLESIAGQVASGCNMIFFVTGNGSITNFPFVPTVKIVTTTNRYQLLSQDMDVNAGAYLDGTPMDELGQEMFELTLDVASGMRSVGEVAGHAQVQLWRDWPQTDDSQLEALQQSAEPNGQSLPLTITPTKQISGQFQARRGQHGLASDQIGLILPTSLCAGQIGRMTAEMLNQKGIGRDQLSRFVSLVHTEGCGCSSGASEELYVRTLLGYLTHPLVKHCLLLEHGCEKTHNDFMRHRLEQAGLNPQDYGWASIQLDGGIEPVMENIEAWFTRQLAETEVTQPEMVGLEQVRLGLAGSGPLSNDAAVALAQLTRSIVAGGGLVIVPAHTSLLSNAVYMTATVGQTSVDPSLAYGQQPATAGFHVMETPSHHWVETLTGLGATGVEVILAYAGQYPLPGHPLVPVVQVSAEENVRQRYAIDLDLVFAGDATSWPEQTAQLLLQVLGHEYTPKPYRQGNVDFQITRGLLGISM